MFDFINNLLKKNLSEQSPEEEEKLQIASCALLLEIASADGIISDIERSKIVKVMKDLFSISTEYVKELIELAESKIKDSVSSYEFTAIINEHFSREEKQELLQKLWNLILVDGTLDKYEDHLVRRIASNLKLEHRDVVEAKLAAKEKFSGKE